MVVCGKCGTEFTRIDNLRRHERGFACKRKTGKGECDGAPTKRVKNDTDALSSSSSASTSSNNYCSFCNVSVPANKMSAHVRTLQHRSNSSTIVRDGVQLLRSAFKNRICSYRISSNSAHIDFKLFFADIKSNVLNVLEDMISIHRTLKVNMEVFAIYYLETQECSSIKSFNTVNKIIDEGSDITEIFDVLANAMESQTTEFDEKDSGWALEKILYAEVNVNKFSPLGGSSYVRLPKSIEAKRAVVNIHNEDEFCFAWAITSALFPTRKNPSMTCSYPHFSSVLNVQGMSFPVKLTDIAKFESINGISVNVYGLESRFENNKTIYEIVGPLRYAKNKLRLHVNLLYITDDEGVGHYCWIKDLSSLAANQLSKDGHKKYFCDGCIIGFRNPTMLKMHQLNDCNHIYSVTPTTNERVDKFGKTVPGNILKFENFEKQMQIPFIIYCDFESLIKPIDTCEPDPSYSFTNKEFSHEPHSFAYIIKCSFNDSITKFVSYRGSNAAKEFVRRIEIDIREIFHVYLKDIKPMAPLSPQQQIDFDSATVCHICGKPFTADDIKVRDHNHLIAQNNYRGASHSVCNIGYKLPNFVPILFHNMAGYDLHLFIKQLCAHGDRIDVIAQSKEKYISFTKYLHMYEYKNKSGKTSTKFFQMRFIDSFKFLSASLDNLSSSLESNDFVETKKHFPIDVFNVMRMKGVFPYSFVDNISKLEVTSLPSKIEFYDKLSGEHISDEEYERAAFIWKYFKCKNLGEYSDVYLKTDVLLLCDVFERFRRTCLETYHLDPSWYYTTPGLAFDSMMKYTKIELELITDIDIINFFKKGIRGGISQCSRRSFNAANKFLDNYNPQEKSTFITYLDSVNLYGHSLSQLLPTGNFKWLTQKEISEFKIEDVPSNSDHGFVLECDVIYPQSLHDDHKDLPFLVESLVPPQSKSKIPKLIPNLNNKKHYICHYKILQQAIQFGLVLEKIHKILSFSQSCWLKKYIDLNSELRSQAKTKFEKDLYKLMNNSVFGKTLENVDQRQDIKLLTHWKNKHKMKGAAALIAQPNYKTCSIFHENFVAIHMGKVKVLYNKPIYIGFTVLELSKLVMYQFYYGVIKKHFNEKASLLYMDTDSFIIGVETDNFYDFMRENISEFDTSNYKVNNKFHLPVIKGGVGKMKDEFPDDIIQTFYGTGAKAYYVKSLSNQLKKAKGVKKVVIERFLDCEDYKNIVEKGGTILRKMYTFSTELHNIFTEVKNKVALSYCDNKRFLIPGSSSTLPWGHQDIQFYQTDPEYNVELILRALESHQSDDLVSGVANNNHNQLAKTENENNLDKLVQLLWQELETYNQ